MDYFYLNFSYHYNEVTVIDIKSVICSSIMCNWTRDSNFIAIKHKQKSIYKIYIYIYGLKNLYKMNPIPNTKLEKQNITSILKSLCTPYLAHPTDLLLSLTGNHNTASCLCLSFLGFSWLFTMYLYS